MKDRGALAERQQEAGEPVSEPRQGTGEPILKVDRLQTHFFTDAGTVRAVDGVSFTLHRGEALGVVGESGCGKSVMALSIMRLVPYPGRIVGGTVRYGGQDLLRLSEREMRRLRGRHLAMIFQDPLTTLNPVLRVGDQITESLRLHYGDGRLSGSGRRGVAQWLWERLDPVRWWRRREQAWRLGVEMLQKVGIPSPEQRMLDYPYQFSGGMRQRAMIAIALSCNPAVLIADEPTTALDVTVQAQTLELMADLQQRFGTSVLFISHDLGVVSEFCDRVLVMYAGQVVEVGPVGRIVGRPLHPYTQGLIGSIPPLGRPRGRRLTPIPGVVPELHRLPQGCRFQDRCPMVRDLCRQVAPGLVEAERGHQVACHRWEETAAGVKAFDFEPVCDPK